MKRRDFLTAAGVLPVAGNIPLAGQPPGAAATAGAETVDLAGDWQVRLDPGRQGEAQQWPRRSFTGRTMPLPGSTDQAGLGTRTRGADLGYLTRTWKYDGPCWYQRTIHIPEGWRGRRVRLFLERCHWESRAWLDGKPLGRRDSLSTPHCYELGRAAPGEHRLTLRVDNSPIVDIGRYGHSYTEQTQSIWNGVVGRIELQSTPPVWVETVRVFPATDGREVVVDGVLGRLGSRPVTARLSAGIREAGGEARPPLGEARRSIRLAGRQTPFRLEIPSGSRLQSWDEFHPVLYELETTVATGNGSPPHRRVERFGMRTLGTIPGRITWNGQPVFLRGTLECCIFPETGYPPTDVAHWRRLFANARAHGLNHVRFHSWCPPEAAFTAADEAGFLLHVETPLWIDQWMCRRALLKTETEPPLLTRPFGQDPAVAGFIRHELRRILDAYGNHPSFGLMCIGNELYGDYELLNEMIGEAKRRDPRRLYSCSTARRTMPEDDYHVTHKTAGGAVRGVHGPGTLQDFRAARRASKLPVVSHEVGQWVTHPDYSEIYRYVGPLQPRNLESFRRLLARRGLLEQAADFQRASGKFAWKMYKDEIETISRSLLAGFQLLQLQDFPGQGEALVGLLDSFWESKGILTPAEFRRFCSATVPLLRTEKFVWSAAETFTAAAEVIHHGPAPLADAVARWSIHTDTGRRVAAGRFPRRTVPPGDITALGRIEVPLAGVREAAHWKLEIALPGTAAVNDWDLWVYPRDLPAPPRDVLVTRRLDRSAHEALAAGRRVLLLSPPGKRNRQTLKTRFLPVYWSFAMFSRQPGILGLLCDPRHPALANFPTAFHADWQWYELLEGGKAFILDGAPPDFRPLVQVIDDFHRAHRLGAVFETRVGPGRLVVSGLDLETDLAARLVARQLRHSLLAYMASERFRPSVELEPAVLGPLLG